MWRVLIILLVSCCAAHSEESGPRKPENKAETSQSEQDKGGAFQQAPAPFPFWMTQRPISPTINVYTAKHAGEESQCAEPKDWKEWGSFAWCSSLEWLDAERIIAIWTVVLGFATCILGIATWKLWRSTDDLVKGAEDTSQRQLRAYIFLDSIDLRRFDIDGKWRILIAWKNTGATRARRFIARVSHRVLDLSQQSLESFDFQDETDAQTFRGLIGPNQSVNPPPIPVTSIHLFGGDDMPLLIWGWAEYHDVFGDILHRTEFGFRVRIEGDISGKSLIRFEPTERHNAADEDCITHTG
jgi:hypothetical protein